jgi:hypothetical protein
VATVKASKPVVAGAVCPLSYEPHLAVFPSVVTSLDKLNISCTNLVKTLVYVKKRDIIRAETMAL